MTDKPVKLRYNKTASTIPAIYAMYPKSPMTTEEKVANLFLNFNVNKLITKKWIHN